ncbi:hypothetical protein K431DRAFT_217484 [Polychaeton citri CBS 116435]|uniref:Sm domain-containing protein n=1 Tax=Polychaeton citri CBS 116435 TaxID=1314669 RepID=A0A9P4QBZ2_9PEZI|nr:hypothetical protein K431DRAFT_217484 [Polychaeton citri CBS 116435]
MAGVLLPSSTFVPSLQTRMAPKPRNTIIEDTPQISRRRAPPQQINFHRNMASPTSEDFPTPRGNISIILEESVSGSECSSDVESDNGSMWSKRSSDSEFDEMYDMSGSESGEFPIKLSHSVKKRADTGRRSRFPSIVIPSPSEWPTIDKMKKSAVTPLSPPSKIEITMASLAKLQSHNLEIPSRSTAPSLDGSMTSEELASISSCPSTPDIENQSVNENAWEVPLQLDPSAIHMLHQIDPEDQHSGEDHQMETVIEVSEEATAEMREIVESPGFGLRLQTQALTRAEPHDADDEFSPLSIPTPGGFFSSLDSVARHTWAGVDDEVKTGVAAEFYGVPFRSPRESAPPTSIATSFYNVPWTERPSNPVEQTVTVASPLTEGPTTARRIFSPTDTVLEVNEIDENYDSQLMQKAEVNIDRTQMWLSKQDDYMQHVCADEEDEDVLDSFKDVEDAVPKTPVEASPSSAAFSPSKTSVHSIATQKDSEKDGRRISPIHDGTFWEGWRQQKRSARARDVFQHRQARAEAEHVRRTSCLKQHRGQLLGKFESFTADRPSPSRPISSMLPTISSEDESRSSLIGQAERERETLQQINPSAWHVQAEKEILGGQLLTSPIVQSFKGRSDVRILDVAGQAQCSWAWSVALDHPSAEVYTTVFTDVEAHVAESNFQGPENHIVMAAPKLWELPFDDNMFDVVSARNLYAHLRTLIPHGEISDEWDLTLQECLRVLKPGGYLEFDLLDAELAQAHSAGQALSVEFAFKLKTRGYDPCAGKNFLPRLKRAGFEHIKRAWMVLPVADVVPRFIDSGRHVSGQLPERLISINGSVSQFAAPLTGSTKDVRAITGLVGARNWEQWMLKLNSELGRSEEACLEGVAKALQESGRGNAAWRCLVGWARKGMPIFIITRLVSLSALRHKNVHWYRSQISRLVSSSFRHCYYIWKGVKLGTFFKTLVNTEVTVELKNDISIRGTLKSVDQYLNIKLDDISVVDELKYPHLSSVKNVFIRGSVVRYVHLSAASVDTTLLEDATRRGRVAHRPE